MKTGQRHGARKQEFIDLLHHSSPDECWLWPHADNGYGYGRIRWGNDGYGSGPGRIVLGHRLAYELLVGPIPDGLTLDHLCHTNDANCDGRGGCLHRQCVNPGHLEPVTPSVNHSRRKVSGPIARRA